MKTAIAIIVLLFASAVQADIYSCVENGQKVFQGTPCSTEATKATKIKTQKAAPAIAPRLPSTGYAPIDAINQMIIDDLPRRRALQQYKAETARIAAEHGVALPATEPKSSFRCTPIGFGNLQCY